MVDKIKFPERRIKPTIEAPKKIKQPFIVQVASWIIDHSGGLIKNEVQAAYVLLGFSVILIGISLLLFASFSLF